MRSKTHVPLPPVTIDRLKPSPSDSPAEVSMTWAPTRGARSGLSATAATASEPPGICVCAAAAIWTAARSATHLAAISQRLLRVSNPSEDAVLFAVRRRREVERVGAAEAHAVPEHQTPHAFQGEWVSGLPAQYILEGAGRHVECR